MLRFNDSLFLKRMYWILPFSILIIVLSYLFLDKPLAYHFQYANPSLLVLAKIINNCIDPAPNILLWLLAFYVTRYLFKYLHLPYQLLFISISLDASNLIVWIIKRIAGRLRPDSLFDDGLYQFSLFATHSPLYSFPSGHAVTIFAIMCALSLMYRKYTLVFLSIGLMLSFFRVVANAHYLSDILAAAVVAMVITEFVFLSMRKDLNPAFFLK